jgi:hypothetical protein
MNIKQFFTEQFQKRKHEAIMAAVAVAISTAVFITISIVSNQDNSNCGQQNIADNALLAIRKTGLSQTPLHFVESVTVKEGFPVMNNDTGKPVRILDNDGVVYTMCKVNVSVNYTDGVTKNGMMMFGVNTIFGKYLYRTLPGSITTD